MDEVTRGRTLLGLARAAIAQELGLEGQMPPPSELSTHHGAAFVTLELHGRLRGCIGSLVAHRPLHEDVRSNAIAAAFLDPRFPPLTREEFDQVMIEVSVLTPAEPLPFDNEADALRKLTPYEDGLILEYGHHRATFLPQVWKQLPSPTEFLAHLKEKAGLPGDFWSDEIRLSRYRVRKYTEENQNG